VGRGGAVIEGLPHEVLMSRDEGSMGGVGHAPPRGKNYETGMRGAVGNLVWESTHKGGAGRGKETFSAPRPSGSWFEGEVLV